MIMNYFFANNFTEQLYLLNDRQKAFEQADIEMQKVLRAEEVVGLESADCPWITNGAMWFNTLDYEIYVFYQNFDDKAINTYIEALNIQKNNAILYFFESIPTESIVKFIKAVDPDDMVMKYRVDKHDMIQRLSNFKLYNSTKNIVSIPKLLI